MMTPASLEETTARRVSWAWAYSLVRSRGGLAVGAEAGLAVVELELVHGVEDVAVGGKGVLRGGHGGELDDGGC